MLKLNDALINTLENLNLLDDNWDSCGAKKITDTAIKKATNKISKMPRYMQELIEIDPANDGGIYLIFANTFSARISPTGKIILNE